MERLAFLILLCVSSLAAVAVAVQTEDRIPIIFDTDFVMPPHDASMALMLALQSPEIEILGITTVAGNESVETATIDVLKMLEIANQADIPVHKGADMPLVHEKSEYAVQKYGRWYSNEPPETPPGGFATKKAEKATAVSYIVRTVMSRPHQVTIVAIGPLTNIAQAIRAEPGFAENVKKLVIIGGAVALLPDGAGNITPNAEFNLWVDPEAARVTLRSGIPIELSRLNVSRKSALTRDWYEKMVAIDHAADKTAQGYVGTPLRRRARAVLVHVRPDRDGERDRSEPCQLRATLRRCEYRTWHQLWRFSRRSGNLAGRRRGAADERSIRPRLARIY